MNPTEWLDFEILGSRIRNYGRMFERRVVFSLGVTYQTPAETLRAIPNMLREAVESQQPVRFDRAYFQKYGDFEAKGIDFAYPTQTLYLNRAG